MTGPALAAISAPAARRRAGGVLGVVALLSLGLLGVPVAHGAEPVGDAVTIEITAVTPQVLQPGGELTVRATLHNTTTAPIEQLRTTLSVNKFAFTSRSSLASWDDLPDTATIGTVVAVDLAAEPLQPGQSREVTLTTPADSIGLLSTPDGWGPRGLAVTTLSAGSRLGVSRTFLLWFPADSVTPVRLSIVVPLTESPAQVAPFRTDGRLSSVLAVTERHPAVTWAVDAAATDRVAEDDPEGTAWLARLRAALPGRETFALPYADADVAALAHAGLTRPYLEAADVGQQRLEQALGTGPLPRLAWPANAVTDLSTIELAADAEPAVVLLASDGVENITALTYTPTGRSRVATQDGNVELVLSDRVLTGLLAAPGEQTPAVAAQRLLAESSMIARERPAVARHVLIALPRAWAPDTPVTESQLAALDMAPWIDLTPLTTLIDAPSTGLHYNALPSSGLERGELATADAVRIDRAVAALDVFSTVPEDPAAVLGTLPTDLLSLTSVGWRQSAAERPAAIDTAIAAVDTLTSSISVPKGSNINLLAETSEIPISVYNALDQPVQVLVELRPNSPRLVVKETVPAEIPAGETVSVKIPVHAVANGDVRVDVFVLNTAGERIASGDPLTVRVRADWENRATGVFALLLALGVVVGLFRTIRRGRATTRLTVQEARTETVESPGVAEEMALLEDRDRDPERTETATEASDRAGKSAPSAEPDAAEEPADGRTD